MSIETRDAKYLRRSNVHIVKKMRVAPTYSESARRGGRRWDMRATKANRAPSLG